MKKIENIQRIFWYHYNKPLSLKKKEPWLTIHYKGKCIPVCSIKCNVPTFSYNRKEQPRVVIKGKANNIKIFNFEAVID